MMSESKTPESGVREQGMEAVVIPDQKLNYGIRAMMQERISREELDRAFDARFPKEMQRKLRGGRVAVAGLGGLGSNIAVMLARSGVGKLLLVDFDVVDVTNLNRQMYLIPQLGKPKAEALPEILNQIPIWSMNPYVSV